MAAARSRGSCNLMREHTDSAGVVVLTLDYDLAGESVFWRPLPQGGADEVHARAEVADVVVAGPEVHYFAAGKSVTHYYFPEA